MQQKHQEQKLKFGSFPSEIRSHEGLVNCGTQNYLDSTQLNNSKEREAGSGSKTYNGSNRNWQFEPRLHSNSNPNSNAFRRGNCDSWERDRPEGDLGKRYQSGNNRPRPPPGFPSNPRGKGNWDSANRRTGLEHNIEDKKIFGNSDVSWKAEDEIIRRLSIEDGRTPDEKSGDLGLGGQLDHPGPPTGSNLRSVSASDIEESTSKLHGQIGNGNIYRDQHKLKGRSHELDDFGEQLVDSLLLEDESNGKNSSSQHRSSREKVDSLFLFSFSCFFFPALYGLGFHKHQVPRYTFWMGINDRNMGYE